MAKKTKTHKIKKGKLKSPLDVRSKKDIPAFEDMLLNGPMMIVLVYADWCGHCTTYKDNVWTPLKATRDKAVNMASVHYDQLPHTSLRDSKINGYPTVMFVGKDKKPATFNDDDGVPTNAIPNANNLDLMQNLVKSSGTPYNYTSTPRKRDLPDMDAPIDESLQNPPNITLNTNVKNSYIEPLSRARSVKNSYSEPLSSVSTLKNTKPTYNSKNVSQQNSPNSYRPTLYREQTPYREEPVAEEESYGAEPLAEEESYNTDLPVADEGSYNTAAPVAEEGSYNTDAPVAEEGSYNTEAPVAEEGSYNTDLPVAEEGSYNTEAPVVEEEPYNLDAPLAETPTNQETYSSELRPNGNSVSRNLNTPPTNEEPLVDETLPLNRNISNAPKTRQLSFNTPRRDISAPSDLGINVSETPISQGRKDDRIDRTQGDTPVISGGSLYKALKSVKKRKHSAVRKTKKIVKKMRGRS